MNLVPRAALSALALLGFAAFAVPAQASSGAGCATAISRFSRAVENDAATGHMGRSVYNRVKPEIDRAAAACAAGREAEATRMLNATKGRLGYN